MFLFFQVSQIFFSPFQIFRRRLWVGKFIFFKYKNSGSTRRLLHIINIMVFFRFYFNIGKCGRIVCPGIFLNYLFNYLFFSKYFFIIFAGFNIWKAVELQTGLLVFWGKERKEIFRTIAQAPLKYRFQRTFSNYKTLGRNLKRSWMQHLCRAGDGTNRSDLNIEKLMVKVR